MISKYLVAIIVGLFVIALLFYIPYSQRTKNASPQNTQPASVSHTPKIPFKVNGQFNVHIFAKDLGNPRVLVFTPKGTLLVSIPTDNKVYALPDKNGDGIADENKVVIENENHVHGLAFFNNQLFIAENDKVVRFNWDENNVLATKDKQLFSLPPNNDHNNRTIEFDKNGVLYISLGSTCNVCNDKPEVGGSVLVSDFNGKTPVVFAQGLRNAPFIHFNPLTNELWGTEMGRDNLGDTIPPDEINIIRQNKNYGWPNCYDDQIPDLKFNPNAKCESTEKPIFKIPAHNAPLGFAFINSNQFPPDWQGDMLVALHGSWNRSVPDGYKVVHLKVNGNTITSSEDFLTGFLTSSGVLGRPVDLVFDKQGNLYLSDDKTGNIYIIQKPS
jgi:glucose/arabinose dehydrogenase